MSVSFLTDADAAGLPARPSAEEAATLRWLDAARGGCPDAFRHLVELHQLRIHRFCHRYLRDAGEAEEAAQDTFIRAHGALARYRPRASFSTWLYQIALNLCRDRIRRKRPAHLGLDEHGRSVPCHHRPPDQAVMRDADLEKLDRGLAALPEKFRTVLVLSCLEGLDHAGCAAILKCSTRAVEGRLYRARQAFGAWWQGQP